MIDTLSQWLLVPSGIALLLVAVFGLLIGSFLNVVIYRLHTGKSLNGRSHCLSCGSTLCWYELVPVASYAVLLGRCRRCRCRITPRYALVELLTAGLFVLAAVTATTVAEFGLLAALLAVLVVIVMYDYYHFIIPDELTVVSAVLSALLLGHQWWYGATLLELGYTVAASLAGAAFYGALWALGRGRWLGFGDVKLAVPLGLWVGYAGVFSLVVLSFWIGAVVSIALLLGHWLQRRGQPSLHLAPQTLTIKSAVPFAPFMIAAAVAVYFFNSNVLTWFSFTI